MSLFLLIIQTERTVTVPKGNSLMSFPPLKCLSGPYSHKNNSRFLRRAKKDIGHVEFCLFNLIILYPKTPNLISNYCSISPNARSCHTALSSRTIFSFAGRHSETLQNLHHLPLGSLQ